MVRIHDFRKIGAQSLAVTKIVSILACREGQMRHKQMQTCPPDFTTLLPLKERNRMSAKRSRKTKNDEIKNYVAAQWPNLPPKSGLGGSWPACPWSDPNQRRRELQNPTSYRRESQMRHKLMQKCPQILWLFPSHQDGEWWSEMSCRAASDTST